MILLGRHSDGVDFDLSVYTEVKTISHKHAQINYDSLSRSFELISFGRNGTKVNGALFKGKSSLLSKQNKIPLLHNDIIEIGKLYLTFKIE